MTEARVGKLCGRPLSAADLSTIRRAIDAAAPPLRAEVARRVCAALGWHDTLGRPKLMSLKELLEAFIRFRAEVLTRRTRFELNHARDRVAMFLFQPERGGMLMMVNNC
jgi:hypothetical protein